MPTDKAARDRMKDFASSVLVREGLTLLGYREVPTDPKHCGDTAREVMPSVQQVFVSSKKELDQEAFERKLHVARRCIETEMASALAKDGSDAGGSAAASLFFACSLSSRTMVYKGMLCPSSQQVLR